MFNCHKTREKSSHECSSFCDEESFGKAQRLVNNGTVMTESSFGK